MGILGLYNCEYLISVNLTCSPLYSAIRHQDEGVAYCLPSR